MYSTTTCIQLRIWDYIVAVRSVRTNFHRGRKLRRCDSDIIANGRGSFWERVLYQNKQKKRKYGSQNLDFARIRKVFQKYHVRNVAQKLLQLDLGFPAVLQTELDLPVLPRDSKNEVVLDRNRDVQRLMVLNQSE